MLVLSYGMQKSGSTFVFQVQRALLRRHAEARGGRLADLSEIVPDLRVDNYAGEETGLARLVETAGAWCADHPLDHVLIKTHLALPDAVAAAVRAGPIRASATCRHPADIALSLIDAAGRAAGGDTRFTGFRTLSETRPAIADYITRFRSWARVPGVEVVQYEALLAEPEAVERRIAAALTGVDRSCGVAAFLTARPERIGEFNRGTPRRRLGEMDRAGRLGFSLRFPRFSAFIEREERAIHARTAGNPEGSA